MTLKNTFEESDPKKGRQILRIPTNFQFITKTQNNKQVTENGCFKTS